MSKLNHPYITDYCGFDPVENIEMTDAEIRKFFCRENFDGMFGPNEAKLPDGHTFESLAVRAIEMRDEQRRDYSHEFSRKQAVGENVKILDGITIDQFYPVIDEKCLIIGWYGADEGDDDYVLCDVKNGKIVSVGDGCSDAVIMRDDIPAKLAKTL